MPITSTTKKVTALGNDAATVFSFSPVVIPDADSLEVTETTAAGVETVIVRGTGATNYSVAVTTYPGTGSITYPASGGTPLATGESLTIKRLVPVTQTVDLNNQGGYFADVQEGALDKATMVDLQQQEEIDRSLKGPVSFTGTFGALDTPVASYYVRRNAANDGYEHSALVVADGSPSDATPSTVSASVASAGTGVSFSRDDHVHLKAADVSASTTVAGIVELATPTETTTGSSVNRAVTPKGLHDMTSLAGAAWFLDEDSMVTDSATKTASQQSIKAYVDANSGSTITAGTPLVQSPLANATVTQAHGLAAEPNMPMEMIMECLTIDAGWAVGDKIRVGPTRQNNSSVSGWAVYADATNVVLLNLGNAINFPNKSTRANSNVTLARWKLTITPMLRT